MTRAGKLDLNLGLTLAGDFKITNMDDRVLKALRLLKLTAKYQMTEWIELIVKDFVLFVKSLADVNVEEDSILGRETIYKILLTARELNLAEFEKLVLGLITG